MPITDPFGVWGNLGTITPQPNQWITFPLIAYETNPTIRATFICSDFSKIRSYGLLRMVFKVDGKASNYPAIRINPKDEQVNYEFPVPQDLLERGITARSFEVMQKLYYTYYGARTTISWSLQLEELWG